MPVTTIARRASGAASALLETAKRAATNTTREFHRSAPNESRATMSPQPKFQEPVADRASVAMPGRQNAVLDGGVNELLLTHRVFGCINDGPSSRVLLNVIDPPEESTGLSESMK